MSNEYKDWERDKIEEEKEIVAKYPFLKMRADSNCSYNDTKWPMMDLELPDGWFKLFFQMCDDIKEALSNEENSEEFFFMQVKEKFNELTCYHNGSQAVHDIIQKYRYISSFICTTCGKPAEFETTSYLASYCTDCWKDKSRHEKVNQLSFVDTFEVRGYRDGEEYCTTMTVTDEWNRYLQSLEAFDYEP